MSKPTNKPGWNPTDPSKVVEPNSTKKAEGWSAGEKPKAEHFNYLFKNVSDWVDHLDSAQVSEEARAKAAEQAIANTVSTKANSADLSAEITRASAAEQALGEAISAVSSAGYATTAQINNGVQEAKSYTDQKSTAINSSLSAEISRAAAAEQSLSESISTKANASDLSAEVARATAAEQTLSNAIAAINVAADMNTISNAVSSASGSATAAANSASDAAASATAAANSAATASTKQASASSYAQSAGESANAAANSAASASSYNTGASVYASQASGSATDAANSASAAATSATNAANSATAASGVVSTHAALTGTHGVGTIVGTSETQVLTNKDIDGGTASNTSRITLPKASYSDLNNLTRKEATIVYSTDQKKAYVDNGSSLIEVGSGSTVSNSTNYISNNGAETDTSGWRTYLNTAGVSPVNGTGGSPNITWTRSTTSPLRGSASFNLTKDSANRQGEGVSYDFTIDNADQAKVLSISFDYQVVSGTYAAGDVSIYIVQDPSGTPMVLQPAGYKVQAAIVGTKMKAAATFQTASNVTSYRLCFHVASTSTSAYTLAIDNVVVGPQTVQYGAPVTDWITSSLTSAQIAPQGFGTVTNIFYQSRRVGDSLEVIGGFTSGTVTTSEARVGLFLNGGLLTADTSKSGANYIVGAAGVVYSAATYFSVGVLSPSTNASYINFGFQSSTNNILTVSNGNFATSNQAVKFHFVIPILGWSSTVQMSNDSDTRVVAARARKSSTQTITAGVDVPAQVTLDTYPLDTHNAFSGSTYTIPVSGVYRVYGQAQMGSLSAGNYAYVTVRRGATAIASNYQYAVSSEAAPVCCAIISLSAGDQITLWVNANDSSYTVSGGATGSFLEIERLSGPSVIQATETVAIHYTNVAGTSISGGVDTTMVFPTKAFDTHGAFNTSTGVFTAPVSGKYQINLALTTTTYTLTTAQRVRAWIVNNSTAAVYDIGRANGNGASTNYAMNGAVCVNLLAGQELVVKVNSSASTSLNTADGNNQLSIVRVGN